MTDAADPSDPSDDAIARHLRAGRTLEAPPDAVLLRAMAVWRPRTAAAPAAHPLVRAAGALVRRLQAALSHDTGWAPVPAPGLRSTATAVRQLLYSTNGIDIDLRIQPPDSRSGAGWQVHGQLLGPVGAGQALLQCGSWSSSSPWNELCEFSFTPVPDGLCVLLLQGVDWETEIGPFDLQGTDNRA
ncbi:hypothetical protein [Pseudaquabacterium pictum]|uniref:Uncharacterized protein n=1 Tax=Pseudaquabacterium pictum TaxID=2315236 RepID=A0A480AT02_9BURK|nr:hypothetical protein [Rubrivivax pictus]GCL64819.1 hypothetical protein AQPW35_39000 [Rubrivivax pictus]